MKLAKNIIAAICLIMALCMPSLAQRQRDGFVTGTVIDSFGAVIPNVRIDATDKHGKIVMTKTKGNGEDKLVLPQGVYKFSFKLSPWTTFVVSDYQMPHAAKMHLDVSLECRDCEIVNE